MWPGGPLSGPPPDLLLGTTASHMCGIISQYLLRTLRWISHCESHVTGHFTHCAFFSGMNLSTLEKKWFNIHCSMNGYTFDMLQGERSGDGEISTFRI